MAKHNAPAPAKGAPATAPAVATPAPAPAAVVGTPGTPAAKVVPGVLQVTPPKGALRGARAAWYALLQQYNGKPVAEFYAAALANPPSTPAKGALAGKCEPPSGWLGWFKRQGIATVVLPAATPPAANP